MSHDHYEVLGCRRNSSRREIKSAYHRLIYKFHPDRNPDPSAPEVAARLNEAYAVLGDERKRALYDAWIQSSQTESKQAETGRKTSAEAPQIKCARCGRQDATIRLTLMYYVVSALLITYRRGASGLWCQKCRCIEAAKWTCVSGLLGWWGFPWGPIYTVHALFVNGKGGIRPRSQNATILRVLGYQLYQQGKAAEASVALEDSLRLEPNVEASQLLEYLRHNQGERKRSTALLGLAMTAAPSLLIAGLISLGICRVATAPSGYETTYRAPQALDPKPSATLETPPRAKANDLIAELASIVEARAPVVGTHHEGTTTVQDHELDRSRFDEGKLYSIADSVETELHTDELDSDGFLASAYFNAKLFALSVDVIKRMDQGRPIETQADSVFQLGKDPAVSKWLQRSRFASNYAALCHQLRSYSARYHPGTSSEELLRRYDGQESQVKGLATRLKELKDAGDVDSYNTLVTEYNTQIRDLKALQSQGKLQVLGSQKLDLAFNRCLDSGILMSKFQRVDLESHATEIDSLADPTAPDHQELATKK